MSVTLFSVSVDCRDAGKLADFWAQVLERALDPDGTGDFASIGMQPGAAAGPVWMFHRVPEAKTVKNRLHIDFVTADLEDEVQRILTLGATHLGDVEEGGYRWATLADPEGNEFDVVAAPQ
jgi:predicted enzyme related to lactoylglutathione lyase